MLLVFLCVPGSAHKAGTAMHRAAFSAGGRKLQEHKPKTSIYLYMYT